MISQDAVHSKTIADIFLIQQACSDLTPGCLRFLMGCFVSGIPYMRQQGEGGLSARPALVQACQWAVIRWAGATGLAPIGKSDGGRGIACSTTCQLGVGDPSLCCQLLLLLLPLKLLSPGIFLNCLIKHLASTQSHLNIHVVFPNVLSQ